MKSSTSCVWRAEQDVQSATTLRLAPKVLSNTATPEQCVAWFAAIHLALTKNARRAPFAATPNAPRGNATNQWNLYMQRSCHKHTVTCKAFCAGDAEPSSVLAENL